MPENVHILILPSSFPDKDFPVRGIFYKQQAFALFNNEFHTGVIVPDIIQGKYLLNIKLLLGAFHTYSDPAFPFPVIRRRGFNLVPYFSFYQKYIFSRQAFRLFSRYVEKYGKPDIIHAHTSVWAGYAACRISQKTGIPVVVTEHSSGLGRKLFDKWQKKSMAYTVSHADSIIAVSTALKSDIEKSFPIKKEIAVIPNIINVEGFSLAQNPIENRFKLITVANLNKNKGVDILLQALSIAIKKYPELSLTIVGDGDQKQNLISLANKLNIESKIQFTGLKPPGAIAELLKKSGVFVSSSYFETFGIAIAEALACGLPVVVTKSGGPGDFVHPANGLICNPGNPQEMADSIIHVISNYSTFVPEHIRQEIIARFGPESIIDQLHKQYISIVRNQ